MRKKLKVTVEYGDSEVSHLQSNDVIFITEDPTEVGLEAHASILAKQLAKKVFWE